RRGAACPVRGPVDRARPLRGAGSVRVLRRPRRLRRGPALLGHAGEARGRRRHDDLLPRAPLAGGPPGVPRLRPPPARRGPVRPPPAPAPPGALALAAVATVGLDHAGRALIGLLSLVTDLAPKWSEVPFIFDQGSPVVIGVELGAVVLLAPLTEELVFRRVIFGFLATRWGAARALVAVSLAFGLLHLYSPV